MRIRPPPFRPCPCVPSPAPRHRVPPSPPRTLHAPPRPPPPHNWSAAHRYVDDLERYAADVRLVWANCMAFTPNPESLYYQQATRMQTLFEQEFAALLAQAAADPQRGIKRPAEHEAGLGVGGEEEVGSPLFAGGEAKPGAKKPRGRKGAVKVEGEVGPGGVKKPRGRGRPPLDQTGDGADKPKIKRQRKPKDAAAVIGKSPLLNVNRAMPQWQKDQLLDRMEVLKKKKLQHAIELIRDTDPKCRRTLESGNFDEDIVIDLDVMDKKALWALYAYVEKQHTKSATKVRPPPQVQSHCDAHVHIAHTHARAALDSPAPSRARRSC